MITLRRTFALISVTLLMGMCLAACDGMGTNTPTTANTHTPAATTPTTQATMSAQATPKTTGTKTGTSGSQALIHTTTITLNGKKVHVLTTKKGFLLYYYTKDTMLTSKCTGDCAQTWPAVLSPKGTMTISSSSTLPHKLSVHKTANGNQVFYDGHALYTYTGDKQAGQFKGRGLDMAWYLVSTTL